MSMREAATRIGIELIACRNAAEIDAADPDFVISMTSVQPKISRYPTYVNLHEPSLYLHALNRFRNLLSYDGYLTISDSLERLCRDMTAGVGHEERPGFFYCTPQINALQFDWEAPAVASRLRVVYFGTNWSPRMPHLFHALDATGVLRIHGPTPSWEGQGLSSYAGPVPFDGVGPQRTYAQFGIGLAMMDDRWIQEDVISNRIFEISSVGAVAICPDMPWTRKWFGDSVLYFDPSRPVEETAETVRAHHAFCVRNPDRAGAMAKEARQIFERHFAAEHMLTNAWDYHIRQQAALAARREAMPPAPEISVIIRCGGRSVQMIRRAVDSIRSQTYGRFQVIFAKYRDIDLSAIAEDRSGAIIGCTSFFIESGGRAEMLYSALRHIETPYFAVLDDDDFWLPEHMETLFHAGRLTDPDFDMAFSGVVNFDYPVPFSPGVTFDRSLGRFGFAQPLRDVRDISDTIWVCGFVARSDLLTPEIMRTPPMRTAEDSLLVCLLARRSKPAFSWRATAFYRRDAADGSGWQNDPQRADDFMTQTLRSGLLLAPGWLPASSFSALERYLPEARTRLGASLFGELLHRMEITGGAWRINSHGIGCAGAAAGQITCGPYYQLPPGHYRLVVMIKPDASEGPEILGEARVDGSQWRGTLARSDIRRDSQRIIVPFTVAPDMTDTLLEFLCFTWGAGGFSITSMALYEGAGTAAEPAPRRPAPAAGSPTPDPAPLPDVPNVPALCVSPLIQELEALPATGSPTPDLRPLPDVPSVPALWVSPLIQELEALHASTSWRMTAPLRAMVRKARRQPAGDPRHLPQTDAEIEHLIVALRASSSWRLTGPLRVLARAMGRNRAE
jgi:Glycosyl transferase family 2